MLTLYGVLFDVWKAVGCFPFMDMVDELVAHSGTLMKKSKSVLAWMVYFNVSPNGYVVSQSTETAFS